MITRRDFNYLMIGSGLIASGITTASAQAPSTQTLNFTAVEGQEYKSVSVPHAANQNKKIEVIEFFWYGCGHCFALEPYIEKWAKNRPADVIFTQIPVSFSRGTDPHARLFFTLQALNKLDALHNQVFTDMHIKRIPLQTDDQIFAWAGQQGLNVEDFKKAYTSFSVNNAMNQAAKRVADYNITGVPTIFVNNEFQVSGLAKQKPSDLPTEERMIATIDFLINKVRARNK